MKNYRLAIFDWDGTIMNSEARIVDAIKMAARECGLDILPDDTNKQIIGLSLDKAILGLYPDLSQEMVVKMAEAYTRSFLEDSDVDMVPFDGAESLLYGLRQAGFKLAIATGKSRKGLNQVLEDCGFGVYFDMTRTPVESASKPDPLMLHQILEQLDVSVDEAVMIGDTTFDMEMAQNCGMDRIAISHGVHQMHLLEAFDPVAKVDSLGELMQFLMTCAPTH